MLFKEGRSQNGSATTAHTEPVWFKSEEFIYCPGDVKCKCFHF
jgi:hypothetical protein